ncbi:hypothetical protein [Streptomyces sp. NPDC059176]
MSGQARRREQVPDQLKEAARKSPNFGRLYAMLRRRTRAIAAVEEVSCS